MPAAATTTTTMLKMRLGNAPTMVWFAGVWLVLLAIMAQQQSCECRYLPTRSHGDDLDKLRELMLQILESSNEEPQRPTNEGNANSLAQRASWLNKLGGMEAVDGSRKFARNPYESARYY